MIAMAEMRWGAILILVAGAILPLSNPGWSQTAPVAPPAASTNADEWQATDLSLLDFIGDGYDLVSVISPSPHTRSYFLTKPGKIVKCREEASPNSPPPIPPPPTPGQVGTLIPPTATPGQAGTFIPPPSVPGLAGTFMPPADSGAASVRTEFECAVLSRRTSRR
jgi:hypothetical protein